MWSYLSKQVANLEQQLDSLVEPNSPEAAQPSNTAPVAEQQPSGTSTEQGPPAPDSSDAQQQRRDDESQVPHDMTSWFGFGISAVSNAAVALLHAIDPDEQRCAVVSPRTRSLPPAELLEALGVHLGHLDPDTRQFITEAQQEMSASLEKQLVRLAAFHQLRAAWERIDTTLHEIEDAAQPCLAGPSSVQDGAQAVLTRANDLRTAAEPAAVAVCEQIKLLESGDFAAIACQSSLRAQQKMMAMDQVVADEFHRNVEGAATAVSPDVNQPSANGDCAIGRQGDNVALLEIEEQQRLHITTDEGAARGSLQQCREADVSSIAFEGQREMLLEAEEATRCATLEQEDRGRGTIGRQCADYVAAAQFKLQLLEIIKAEEADRDAAAVKERDTRSQIVRRHCVAATTLMSEMEDAGRRNAVLDESSAWAALMGEFSAETDLLRWDEGNPDFATGPPEFPSRPGEVLLREQPGSGDWEEAANELGTDEPTLPKATTDASKGGKASALDDWSDVDEWGSK